jgi:hypothetical protein
MVPNISGTISAAVMVGDISAIFCANNSGKFRHADLSLFSVFMVSCSFRGLLRFLVTFESLLSGTEQRIVAGSGHEPSAIPAKGSGTSRAGLRWDRE